jgi:hypothetical protein
VSRGGPDARVRRVEATATSLTRGQEGGGGRDLRESEVFEGMRARGQEENVSVECLRKSSSRLVHSGCSCLDLFNIRAECTGSIPSTSKHLEFGYSGLENANVQYQARIQTSKWPLSIFTLLLMGIIETRIFSIRAR